MIRKRLSHHQGNYSSPQVGWLFADLLLAIAMIFLITNTSTEPTAQVSPTPTPTPIPTPTPTPTSSSLIERTYQEFFIPLNDPDGLSIGDTQGKTDLNSRVRAVLTQKHFDHRQAGLVIAYGGTGNSNDAKMLNRGTDMAQHTYEVLQDMGQNGHFVFCNAAYYKPLFSIGDQSNQVILHIFFFNQSFTSCS